MLTLQSEYKVPPGEFWYRQTQGINRLFPKTSEIRSLAMRVARFRALNGLERASQQEALEDIHEFTCARLSATGKAKFCHDITKPFDQVYTPARAGTCASCGIKV